MVGNIHTSQEIRDAPGKGLIQRAGHTIVETIVVMNARIVCHGRHERHDTPDQHGDIHPMWAKVGDGSPIEHHGCHEQANRSCGELGVVHELGDFVLVIGQKQHGQNVPRHHRASRPALGARPHSAGSGSARRSWARRYRRAGPPARGRDSAGCGRRTCELPPGG